MQPARLTEVSLHPAVTGQSKQVWQSQGKEAGDSGAVDCLAHFLAMCSKLIYEDERIVRDVIERKWALDLNTLSAQQV